MRRGLGGKRKIVKAACDSCDATGLYSGMCEGEGVAVICCRCDGTGCEEISYTPFTKRKPRRDIKVVRLSRGTFILSGVGPTGSSITYKQFLAGKRPKKST